MDASTLAGRVRGILGTQVPAAVTPPARGSRPPEAIAATLGGTWQGDARAQRLVVERHYAAGDRYGSRRIGEFADALRAATAGSPLVYGQDGARPPMMFFDLETTGLSGGAGTLAFLVGCGWFDEDGGFRTRQYVLARLADEPALLEAFGADLAAAGLLVSFNGRSFDAPLLETRFLFHRLPWIGEGRPQLDMLHPARRFWRDAAGCSLGVLEAQVLGARRTGDVPGFEIPARYFQFLRDGDGRPLGEVLEHNRLDLLSLAGLMARVAHLTEAGPTAARDAREALALGHLLARAGEHVKARPAFERAVASEADAGVRAAALRALALDARRRRAFEEAAVFWRRLLNVANSPPAMAREATTALAVHHEHRARDLAAAKAFAMRGLDYDVRAGRAEAIRYRLARLDRKIGRERAEGPLLE